MKKNPHILAIVLFPMFLTKLIAKKNKVGGQAIIEGVMMRSKQKISWAVRKPNGEIAIERFPFISLSKRHKFLALPIFRGAINLYESLKLGYKALSRSAELALDEAKPKTVKNSSKNKFSTVVSLMVALAISLGLFMYVPMQIAQFPFKDSPVLFNVFAGIIRISLFVVYIVLISFWKEIRRIFEYHGAEHKAIFAYEDDKELTLDNMRPYTTLHPRCGTSFLVLVALICIFLFSIIDTCFTMIFGPYPNVFIRFFVHITLIPIVGGTSYEILRLSDKYQKKPFVKFFILPGLWLQKITTKEPTDDQLQIAASALKASL